MSVVGTIAAAATLVITGGNVQAAMLAYSIGSGVESAINPPKIEGPRLDELTVQTASYGAPIPFEYGTNRHAGNIIWPKVIELKESKHTESAKGGPEQTSYSYSANFAVGVCEGPIAGILKIFANKKVIYDATPGAEVSQDPAIGGLRIYLGTETQQPDPLIEATDGPSPAYLGYAYVVFEDLDLTEFANRPPQLEFIVVTEGNDEIPSATKFGEAFSVAYPSGTFKTAMDAEGRIWLSTPSGHAVRGEDGKWVMDFTAPMVPQVQIYDPETNEILHAFELPHHYENGNLIQDNGSGAMTYSGGYMFIGNYAPLKQTGSLGMAIDTTTYAVSVITPTCISGVSVYWPGTPIPVIDNNAVYFASANGLANAGFGFMPRTLTLNESQYQELPDRSGNEVMWNAPYGFTAQRHYVKQPANPPYESETCDAAPTTMLDMPNWASRATPIENPRAVLVQGRSAAIQGTYVQWVARINPVTGYDVSGPDDVSHADLPGIPGAIAPIAWDEKNQVLWAFAAAEPGGSIYNTLYAITHTLRELTVTATGFSYPYVNGDVGANVIGLSIDPATGYLRVLRGNGTVIIETLDPINGEVVDTYSTSALLGSNSGKIWDYPELGKLIYTDGYAMHDIPYANALDANPVQLAKIVADLCQRAGLAASDIDVSQLTDMVDGYVVPRQMSARAAIEPLQTAFYFDAVESDDKLKFVKRAASAPILIPMEDRAARDFGSDLPDSLSVVRAQDYELPVQCDVEYADIDADHLVGNQYERRITKDTKQRINIQSPVVMTAAKAKEVAMVTLYRAWLNQTYRFTTTRKWAHLEPTDLVTLPTMEASYTARITSKREQPSGIIEWEAAMESVEVYTQVPTGAAPTNYVKQAIYDPGSTTLQLLDIPILRDADNDGGAYVAMAGTGDGWKGAQLFKSSDSGSTYESVLTQANEAAIGFTQSALPDFSGGNIFDAGSSVTVFMTSGQPLTSATEEQVLNGANLAVIGRPGQWEVVQFKNASLIAPNTYQLSGFLRGRRGTEWATGLHQSSDAFILASVATWSRLEAEDLGLPRLFKAPPFRTPLSGSAAQSFTNTAVGLKPFAPVDLAGVRDESGNLTLSWHRRTRLKSDTLHLPTPLGEASESYSVDIISGGAVVRTLTSSSPSVVYSAADQAADGIAPGAAVTASVYQVSQAVGRGYPLKGTV